MRIISRLPIFQQDTIITVQGEPIQVWKNQIVVWLSIQDASRPFPAILDTGHSHNLSISLRHPTVGPGPNSSRSELRR